ncbi:TPA: hypothetical protein ACPVZF_000002 [Vibrio parahaemolyticus]
MEKWKNGKMENMDIAKIIENQINNTPIGKDVTINFKGAPTSVDIQMEFAGGWVITQTVIPGNSFIFTRGEDQYLKSISITFNKYEGLS